MPGIEYEYRPIELWPGPLTRNRKRAPFRASYSATLDLLERELRFLGATQVVLQVALGIDDIRLDGRPRAGSKPTHPGIILSFGSRHGPLSYPCDRFDSWEDNLRAIALSLEHLRAVDRYGVTRRGEQYRGWSQLPPPVVTPPPMTVERAMRVLGAVANGTPITRDNLQAAYHRAALATHPDRGGRREDFEEARRAYELLEKAL